MGFETVCVGFETVCPEKDKQTAFYSPLPRSTHVVRIEIEISKIKEIWDMSTDKSIVGIEQKRPALLLVARHNAGNA